MQGTDRFVMKKQTAFFLHYVETIDNNENKEMPFICVLFIRIIQHTNVSLVGNRVYNK